MGLPDRQFEFDSPAAAIAAMVARASSARPVRATERVGLEDASGRLLGEDVRADRDSPAFDHAAMDGYALRAADLARSGAAGSGVTSQAITLPITGESRIGEPPPDLPDDLSRPCAVRIATGAPIPAGADAVVRREDVLEHPEGDAREVVSVSVGARTAAHVKRGDHIRRRGENAPAGAVVLHAGEVVSGAALATLAAVGVARPAVIARLRVAIITTGDELVAPEAAPSAFQLRNSNGPALKSILSSQAWVNVTSVSHLRDDEDLVAALGDACTCCDAVILTGGVSMGHRDPVRDAVERVGAQVVFHGLPQRPGKPMLAAIMKELSAGLSRAVPIFGLPGNPVSSLVTCVRIVQPVLAACAGARRPPASCLPRLIEVRNPDGRALDSWWHRLVRLVADDDGAARAELIDSRGSGDVIATGMSDGFVEVPPRFSGVLLPFFPWPAGTR